MSENAYKKLEDSNSPNASAKRGLFGAFYIIQKDMILGKKFFYVSSSLMLLQLFYFPLAVRASLPWPSFIVDTIAYAFRIYDYTYLPYVNEWLLYLEMSVALIFVVAAVGGILVLSYGEMVHEKSYRRMAPFVEILLRLIQTVLLIPFVSTFVTMMLCPSSVSVCNTTSKIAIQIFGVILLALLLITVSLTSLFMIRHSTMEDGEIVQNIFAAAHGRVELGNTWVRLILAITLASIPETGNASVSVQAFWVAMLTIGGLCLVGMYFYYMPFLNLSWNRFCVLLYGVFLFECICAIVCVCTQNASDHASVVLVILLPLFIYSLDSLFHNRISYLSNSTRELTILGIFLTELHIRLLRNADTAPTSTVALDVKLEEAFRNALTTFPTSAYLKLHLAEICSNSKRLIKALQLLREVNKMNISWDQQFVVFCLSSENIERNGKKSGAAAFITFDAQVEAVRESIIQTLKLTGNFWKLLRLGRFSVNDLAFHGAKIHQLAQKANHKLTKLLNLSRSNADAQRLYAFYVNYILNDSIQANKIMEKLNHSSSDKSGGYAVCTLSGNADSIGKIIDVTQALCTMFGFRRSELIGQNVCMLIPPPIDKFHDHFMHHFTTHDIEFESQTRHIFGLHSDGYIFSVNLTISPSTNEDCDIILIGHMTQESVDVSKHTLLVDATFGFVTGCSKEAPSIIDIDPDEIFAMSIHIHNIFPSIFNTDGRRRDDTCVKTEVNFQGQQLEVEVKAVSYKSRNSTDRDATLNLYIVNFSVVERRPDSKVESTGIDTVTHREGGNEEADFFENNAEPIDQMPRRGSIAETIGQNLIPRKTNASDLKYFKAQSVKSGISGNGRSFAGRNNDSGSMGSSVTDANELTIAKIHSRISLKLRNKDPKVEKFTRFVKYFVLVFSSLAVSRVVVVVVMYDNFLASESLILLAAERTHYLFGIAMIVEVLRQPLVEINNVSYFRLVPENVSSSLVEKLDMLISIHEILVNSKADNAAIHEEMMFTPNMPITQNGVNFDNISFHMSIMQFVEHAENYIYTDDLQCLDSCVFLLNNGPFALYQASIGHTTTYYSSSISILDRVLSVSLFSIIFVTLLLIVAFVVGFAPMFQLIRHKRQALGDAFIKIPAIKMKMLEQRSKRRIKLVESCSILANDSNLLQDADDIENDVEQDAEAHDEEPILSRHNSRLLPSTEAQSEVKPAKTLWQRAFIKAATSAKVGPQTQSLREVSDKIENNKIRLRKESSMSKIMSVTVSIIRVGFIFWYVLAFFCIISYMDFSHIPMLKTTTAELYISARRKSFVSYVQFWSTFDNSNSSIVAVSGLRNDYTAQVDLLQEVFEMARAFDDYLMMGNKDIGTSIFTATSGPLYDLYFDNICTDQCISAQNDKRNIEMPTDLAMADDMKHGMVLTFQRYWIALEKYINSLRKYKYNATTTNLIAVFESQERFVNLPLYFALSTQAKLAMELYESILSSEVVGIRVVDIVVLCVFCFFMIFIYLATLKVFRQMDKDMKNAQTLLYMLPLDVIEEVQEISSLISAE